MVGITNKLVQIRDNNLDKGVIVTTSMTIAENAGVAHRGVRDRITSKWKSDLEEFGRLHFKKAPIETKGGVQTMTYYELNEQQATLLFTYLQNTKQVRDFKKRLIKAFFAMRSELLKRKETRDIGKVDRKALTDMIEESGEQKRMHNKGYVNYTNLVYKSIFGVNKKKLIINRDIIYKNGINLREFLSEEEIEQVRQREVMVGELLKLDYDYVQIKGFLKVK